MNEENNKNISENSERDEHKSKLLKIFISLAAPIAILLTFLAVLNITTTKLSARQPEKIHENYKANIYPIVKGENFILSQKKKASFISNSKYIFFIQHNEGKMQREYNIDDVSINDILKSDEQPYAKISTTKRNDVVIEEKLILFLPTNYEIRIIDSN